MIDIESSNAHRKRPVTLCSHLYPKAVVILGHGPILHAKKRRQHDAVGKSNTALTRNPRAKTTAHSPNHGAGNTCYCEYLALAFAVTKA